MANTGPASDKLRAFVRERVAKDGTYYEWGNATKLAKELGVSSKWVNAYAIEGKGRATLDQMIAICTFYRLDATTLIKPKAVLRPADPPDPVVAGLAEVLPVASELEVSLVVSLVNAIRRRASLPDIARGPTRKTAHRR